jgi:hypothetical protein
MRTWYFAVGLMAVVLWGVGKGCEYICTLAPG